MGIIINGMKIFALLLAANALTINKKDGEVDPYKVPVPERFTNDDDDIFMRSMYNNYTTHEKVKDKKTGKDVETDKPVITKESAYEMAKEVLETHKGITGA